MARKKENPKYKDFIIKDGEMHVNLSIECNEKHLIILAKIDGKTYSLESDLKEVK